MFVRAVRRIQSTSQMFYFKSVPLGVHLTLNPSPRPSEMLKKKKKSTGFPVRHVAAFSTTTIALSYKHGDEYWFISSHLPSRLFVSDQYAQVVFTSYFCHF